MKRRTVIQNEAAEGIKAFYPQKETGQSGRQEENTKHNERVTERELVFSLYKILNSCKCLNSALQSVVDAIPRGTHYPDEIRARLSFDGKVYCSSNFAESKLALSSTFKTAGSRSGSVECFYQPVKCCEQLQPSLGEPQALIDCISMLLVSWLNKQETESHLQNVLATLEAKVEEKTLELKAANLTLNQVNRDICASIRYANRIQRAVLPTTETIKSLFDDAFILYKPKDIVSGDFFWVHQSGPRIFFVCADCTGHGVPGALMSMIGGQLLDHIIVDKGIFEPELILTEMDKGITRLFTKGGVEYNLRDGMALSLFVVNRANSFVSFAGAFNNAYMISNDTLITFTADRHSIGGMEYPEGKAFQRTEMQYRSGDQLYMFTDGFADQIGGPRLKKFSRRRLLELISELKYLDQYTQKQVLDSYFTEWQKDHFQVDDVTVLGIKL